MTQTHQDDHQTEVRTVAARTAEVDADRTGVAVDEGPVTLSGQVPSYPEEPEPVQVVADEIEVRPPCGELTDADIARAAARAFTHSIAVPPGSVTATVHDHVVTLAGTVHGEYQREAARRTVASLPGVVGVRDTVALEPTAVVSAQDALAGITAALVRNARLDAQHVHVDVTGSAVTLTGRVSSSHERSEAGQAAWSSPGVTHVHNRLTVAP